MLSCSNRVWPEACYNDASRSEYQKPHQLVIGTEVEDMINAGINCGRNVNRTMTQQRPLSRSYYICVPRWI